MSYCMHPLCSIPLCVSMKLIQSGGGVFNAAAQVYPPVRTTCTPVSCTRVVRLAHSVPPHKHALRLSPCFASNAACREPLLP